MPWIVIDVPGRVRGWRRVSNKAYAKLLKSLRKHKPTPKPPVPAPKPSPIPAPTPAPKPKPKPSGPITMYDDVNVALLPVGAAAYAGYVDGKWQTFKALQQRFPKAHLLDIAVFPSSNATCLDVEPGDATIAQAPAWVKRQLARGAKRPVVYTSLSQAQALTVALAKAGIQRSQYRLWTAHYNYVRHFCGPHCGLGFTGRADATQWTDKALGRSLDESVCSATFFS